MLDNIDTSKPIPPEWRVRGADSHLHSIGLSLFKPQLHTNRRLLYHPLIILSVMIVCLCRSMVIVYCDVSDIKLSSQTQFYLGNLDYYIMAGYTTNVIVITLDAHSSHLEPQQCLNNFYILLYQSQHQFLLYHYKLYSHFNRILMY